MIILPCEKDEITSLEQARAMGVSFEKKRWEEMKWSLVSRFLQMPFLVEKVTLYSSLRFLTVVRC